jgi:hypothetical protein
METRKKWTPGVARGWRGDLLVSVGGPRRSEIGLRSRQEVEVELELEVVVACEVLRWVAAGNGLNHLEKMRVSMRYDSN